MTIKETPTTIIQKTYVANDGKEFNSRYECEKYEARKDTLPPNIPYIECYDDLTESRCWFYVSNYAEHCDINRYFKRIHPHYLDTDDLNGNGAFFGYPDWVGFHIKSSIDGDRLYSEGFRYLENGFTVLKKTLYNIKQLESKEKKDEDN